ncbi:MAG: zinc-ribbon domain-containing protein, partial [Myxococcota bacterium]
MDIRCAKCGTEYELDDAKIPQQGLTVKCTTCGFIFKALKPVEPIKKTMLMYSAPPVEPRPAWVIRKPDGTTFQFNELAALQRLVKENKVSENDEISRQGEGWRRISEIPEFAGFFIVKSITIPPAPACQPAVQQQRAPVSAVIPAAPVVARQTSAAPVPVMAQPEPVMPPPPEVVPQPVVAAIPSAADLLAEAVRGEPAVQVPQVEAPVAPVAPVEPVIPAAPAAAPIPAAKAA